jgi:hypothetical protein
VWRPLQVLSRSSVDALMHIAAFGFTIWESKKALTRLWRG